jgi:purine-nucleoside phosphorylase
MKELTKGFAKVAVVLGSGLNESIEEIMQINRRLLFSEVGGLHASTAPGHTGCFLEGTIGGLPVIAMQGRLHYYEGYDIREISRPVKVLHDAGVDTILMTNAAGGINLNYKAGDLMIIKDHINFMGTNPLIGPVQPDADRFPDMTYAYDRELIEAFKKTAATYPIDVHEGTYIATTGPSYETPAEIRAFRTLGADAVGMSTVPEVICANSYRMRVFAVSLISNMAAGVLDKRLTEEEVLEAGRKVQSVFAPLMADFIKGLAK